MKKLQLLFAFLAHTQVGAALIKGEYQVFLQLSDSSVCLYPVEGSICPQKLLGSVSASLV